ncbi:hypothetical protein ES319_A08G213600v1 [Gossypium barbadense]|uniref:RNA polymerase II subunit B1 CTD phosphatase RPAP2 homolog n=1 Tax=Gossypium barbadense TaxID=3634 RepID=A0A5J5UV77_GOSBA|nr:hypothetical protein ES319_A08G213600v1 [Gossypium barbadense]
MAKDQSISGLEAVHKIQLHLLDGIRDEKQLFSSGSLISQSGYEDVVTERSISNICSYPLCRNPLPSEPRRTGRYRSFLKEHRVYDLQETNRFCSADCLINSQASAGSLQEEPGEVSLVGPSNAIEGYVPQIGLVSKPSPLHLLRSAKLEIFVFLLAAFDSSSSKLGNSKGDSFVKNKIDFTSAVIMNNEYTISESPGSLRQSQRAKPSSMKNVINEMDFASEIIMNDEYTVSKTPPVSVQGCSGSSSALREKDSSIVELPSTKYVYQSGLDTAVASSEVVLKSELRSARAKKLNRSVTWADNKDVDNARKGSLCEVKETDTQKGDSEICGRTDDGDDDNMLRFASAKVCAMALRKAAAAVASGDSDVNDVVSEAGLIILPHALEADKEEQVKNWPTKPGIPRSDIFNPEDSWCDTPPEGFSLTHLSVNGREYPQKIVLRNGCSSEIKETLACCISRALTAIVTALRLPIPISTLEQGMGRLLDTMSFWQVIVLLFVGALSACRVPSLTPLMTNGRMLLQSIFSQFFCICIRHDSLCLQTYQLEVFVLDGAQISMEEYEV